MCVMDLIYPWLFLAHHFPLLEEGEGRGYDLVGLPGLIINYFFSPLLYASLFLKSTDWIIIMNYSKGDTCGLLAKQLY